MQSSQSLKCSAVFFCMLAEIYRSRIFIVYNTQYKYNRRSGVFCFLLWICIPCLKSGRYRLIRFVVTLASYKAHIHKMFTQLFLDFLSVHYCFILLCIHEHICNTCSSLDVICFFSLCLVMLRCQTAVNTKRKSFQLSSISVSVLDFYLRCMTLVL